MPAMAMVDLNLPFLQANDGGIVPQNNQLRPTRLKMIPLMKIHPLGGGIAAEFIDAN